MSITILAADTSTLTASAAVITSEGTVFESNLPSRETHSRTLLPVVTNLLAKAGLTIHDVDLLAAGVGPGSFTGLRIGLSALKGLAYGAGKKLIGVPSLDAMVHELAPGAGQVCPVIDARKGQIYTAVYTASEDRDNLTGSYGRNSDIAAFDMEHLTEVIKVPTVFFGEGALKWEHELKKYLGRLFTTMQDAPETPRALHVARIAGKMLITGAESDPLLTVPLYIRPPDIRKPKPAPCRIV